MLHPGAATAEGRAFDDGGNLIAMGKGTFRIFEHRGYSIV
jgi:acyl-coenzyme A thioesterase PaaI-like protein